MSKIPSQCTVTHELVICMCKVTWTRLSYSAKELDTVVAALLLTFGFVSYAFHGVIMIPKQHIRVPQKRANPSVSSAED